MLNLLQQRQVARLEEVANAPKGASALYDKVLKGAEKREGVKNPHAVAMAVMKTRYYKGRGEEWHKRKEPLARASDAPKYSEACRRERSVRQAEAMAKEANSSTTLGQLFRGKKVPPEWAVWRLLRMRRAASAAQESVGCLECPDEVGGA